jgi:hypothetical protein
VTSDKCVLSDKLMLLICLFLIFEKKESLAKKQTTLTEYFNRVFLNTGCHFN